MKILLGLLIGFCVVSLAQEEANSLQSQQTQTPDLEITLSLDKDVYGQLDPVLLTIVLKNISSNSVTILPQFIAPGSPPIWLNISDSEGRRIRWTGPEVRLGFSALVNEFTVLNPNEEVTITTDLRNMVELDEIIRFTYLLSEEGDYQISAEYITPHPTGFPELTSISNTVGFAVESSATTGGGEEDSSLQNQQIQNPDLELMLSLDKDVYGQFDSVLLTIILKNVSSHPVTVLPNFAWPNSPPIQLNISDPEGYSVQWVGAYVTIGYSPSDFTVLNPHEEVAITTDLRNVEWANDPFSYSYILTKEGSYQILAEYITPPTGFPALTSTSNTAVFTVESN